MKKISVIIPVYNSEPFLRDCIRSLTRQTYPSWEALLIDDGSTDGSLALCQELGRTDKRIRVYHQENKGVSAARNYGLDLADGEYISFLDSDDAIHPLLFEEMMGQVEEHHVEMAFCNFVQVDSQKLSRVLEEASPEDRRPQWETADGEVAERWFHIDHAAVLCGISGLMARELIGSLRFDESMSYGEDTVFKYALFSKRVRTAYSSQQWYYYRVNPKSLSHKEGIKLGEAYSEKAIRIRDSEYRKGGGSYGVVWETTLTAECRQKYSESKKTGDKEQCARVREWARQVGGHPLFRSVDLLHKALFYLCFKCYPLYVPVNWAAGWVWLLMERGGKNR